MNTTILRYSRPSHLNHDLFDPYVPASAITSYKIVSLLFIYFQDGSIKTLWNVGTFLSDYDMQNTRKF